MKKAAIYARVSTNDQTPENQLLQLRQVAENRGWTVTAEYVDHGISGAKGRDKRPRFDEMLKAATRGEFQLIMSTSVDRLGRSLSHLVEFLDDIHAKGVDLYLHQQGIDTTTPTGKMMFQMCGVFAEFERAMMADRIKAGLSRARAEGKQIGRPKVSAQVEDRIRELRSQKRGMLWIAREVGVGTGTVQRVVAA
jgi:DNA invertase Pin-like site-specific DNA recombinase